MNTTIIIVIIVCAIVVVSVAKNQATMAQIKKQLKNGALVIDVRSEQEYRTGHFGGAVNIPYDQFETRISEIGNNKERPVIVYCYAGSRSAVAFGILRKNGFSKAINARSYSVMKRFEKEVQ
jgi:phage shock protein E